LSDNSVTAHHFLAGVVVFTGHYPATLLGE
jgi:hypothetical protein